MAIPELNQTNIVGNYLAAYGQASQQRMAEQNQARQMRREDKADSRAELEHTIKLQSAIVDILGNVRDGDAQGFEGAKQEAMRLGLPQEAVSGYTVADLPRLRAQSGAQLRDLQARAQEANIGLGRDQLNEQIRHNKASEEADRLRAEKTAGAQSSTNQDYIAAVANYDAPLPSPRSPDYAATIAAAKAANPEFNAAEYKLRADAKASYRKGTDSRAVQYINTAMDHLQTLKTVANALGSGDVRAINAARNAWFNQFGSALPSNLNAAKQIVGNEVVKGIVGGQNAVSDREEAQKIFDGANSPEQIIGAADTVTELLAGQLRGFERRYKAATKANDFGEYLSEDSRKLLAKGQGGGDGSPKKITSKAEYDALPAGTQYIAPDGSLRTKK